MKLTCSILMVANAHFTLCKSEQTGQCERKQGRERAGGKETSVTDLQLVSDGVSQSTDQRKSTLVATQMNLLHWETCAIAKQLLTPQYVHFYNIQTILLAVHNVCKKMSIYHRK